MGFNQQQEGSNSRSAYNTRVHGFGTIKEEIGETSRASDSAAGDKSFAIKVNKDVDQMKDMLFDSQIEEEDYPERKREKMGLIDKNAPQSHNYSDRGHYKNQKNHSQRQRK